ncbi:MAG: hypothetical protein K2P78_09540, partial [Gemmataceae bacterium]|nr:hypothetical protein [Gemmataceae bacterium]
MGRPREGRDGCSLIGRGGPGNRAGLALISRPRGYNCRIRPRPGRTVTYLVDGYNLLYAVGLATRAMSAAAFDRAR